ncbi:MAG TPA: SET domain-containing protein [Terriglobales bacterium]|nr:SET domain-containing protein [Terriglobales bacterium]
MFQTNKPSRPIAVAGETEKSGTRHFRLVAQATFSPGEEIWMLAGEVVDVPDRYSVQVGKNDHLRPQPALPQGAEDIYLWRYLNHSCNPNTRIVGRKLLALAAIAAGDELTFDYNCTEYEMATPFPCRCGWCAGATVRGFKYLSAEERAQRRGSAAPYLWQLLAEEDDALDNVERHEFVSV